MGGVILKLNPLWYHGIPDRLLLLPGAKIFFVELKRKKSKAKTEKARANQKRWIHRLRALGFSAGVVAGPEALKLFIHKYIESDRIPSEDILQ